MTGLRPLLRTLAWHSGALSLARNRQRHSLTVAMLHRVLDPGDPDFAQADPTYTLATPLFDELLAFLQANYSVVSLRDVLQAAEDAQPLPDHAVLITFDDGWADNLRYAAPLLMARSLPAVVFVVPDAVLTPGDVWWQETIYAAARSGALRPEPAADSDLPHPLGLVARLVRLDEQERSRRLAAIRGGPCHARMMLTQTQVAALAAFGIDVGVHGYSHAPLTALDDVETELRRAVDAVGLFADKSASVAVLGCPHGRYNADVIAGAQAAGIRMVFTSDPVLNRLERGSPCSYTLGRINVEARRISVEPYRLDAASAARWLWARECR